MAIMEMCLDKLSSISRAMTIYSMMHQLFADTPELRGMVVLAE